MEHSAHIADVLVGSAQQDQRNAGLRYAEKLGYCDLGHGAAEFSDCDDFLSSQKLLEQCDSTDIDGVLSVHSVCSPLKVCHDVVGFYAVKMIDDRKPARVGDERKPDESVDMDGFTFPISEKVDVPVAEFVCAGAQHLAIHSSRLKAITDSIKAADASEVADFVVFTEFGDGDTPPFFDEHNLGPCAISAQIIASFRAHQGE